MRAVVFLRAIRNKTLIDSWLASGPSSACFSCGFTETRQDLFVNCGQLHFQHLRMVGGCRPTNGFGQFLEITALHNVSQSSGAHHARVEAVAGLHGKKASEPPQSEGGI
jgi:hypothetical protein